VHFLHMSQFMLSLPSVSARLQCVNFLLLLFIQKLTLPSNYHYPPMSWLLEVLNLLHTLSSQNEKNSLLFYYLLSFSSLK
jgi:hypothetical protein